MTSMYDDLTADQLMKLFEGPIPAAERLAIDDALYYNYRMVMEKHNPVRVDIERWMRRKRIAEMRRNAKYIDAFNAVIDQYGYPQDNF